MVNCGSKEISCRKWMGAHGAIITLVRVENTKPFSVGVIRKKLALMIITMLRGLQNYGLRIQILF
ncbi:hypothetical protein SDC9_179793 [bioreactor metagenome]|uniref:Uncharacterized protein n=1 Tax=bioreactor metagenome TaxID=1076179 RepID=A0A645GZT1_9ZZZZ